MVDDTIFTMYRETLLLDVVCRLIHSIIMILGLIYGW